MISKIIKVHYKIKRISDCIFSPASRFRYAVNGCGDNEIKQKAKVEVDKVFSLSLLILILF